MVSGEGAKTVAVPPGPSFIPTLGKNGNPEKEAAS